MKTLKLRTLCSTLSLVMLLAILSGCAMESRHKPEHFTCIPTQLFRCEPGEQSCMNIPIIRSLGDVKIVINLADRKIKSYSDKEILTYSDIDSIQEEKGLIYFNGKGYGVDDTYRAWNAVIDRKTGRLYSTSITTGAGHIIYGECYANKQE